MGNATGAIKPVPLAVVILMSQKRAGVGPGEAANGTQKPAALTRYLAWSGNSCSLAVSSVSKMVTMITILKVLT
jgi:hypothetical protein